jgi:hypothetical protein
VASLQSESLQGFAIVAKTFSRKVGEIVIFLTRFCLRFAIDSLRAGVLFSKLDRGAY